MSDGVSYTSTKPLEEFEINKKNKPSDLISRLSELRSQYNCFNESERDAYHTLSEAIEALTENPKFTQVYIETDVYWLERQLDMYKEKIYLNEQTMIVYVPFVTAELVEACGGTIKRRGE